MAFSGGMGNDLTKQQQDLYGQDDACVLSLSPRCDADALSHSLSDCCKR